MASDCNGKETVREKRKKKTIKTIKPGTQPRDGSQHPAAAQSPTRSNSRLIWIEFVLQAPQWGIRLCWKWGEHQAGSFLPLLPLTTVNDLPAAGSGGARGRPAHWEACWEHALGGQSPAVPWSGCLGCSLGESRDQPLKLQQECAPGEPPTQSQAEATAGCVLPDRFCASPAPAAATRPSSSRQHGACSSPSASLQPHSTAPCPLLGPPGSLLSPYSRASV